VIAPHNLGFVPSKIEIYGSQTSDFLSPIEPLSAAEMSTGTQALQRSVIVKADDTNVYVKNATNGVFYRDFSGTTQTTGFLLVNAER
jgi:hypothetical protein